MKLDGAWQRKKELRNQGKIGNVKVKRKAEIRTRFEMKGRIEEKMVGGVRTKGELFEIVKEVEIWRYLKK